MKKLTKIKLVNWHLFSNQTIEINDNTLISGENGSGKSTLLDAIQYLLVGGRSGAKFNIAANEDAKRTLEGYVRGRIGSETKEYLREHDVISHVALEFYDEEEDLYSIIGVILDLPKSSNIKERFYVANDLSIHDSLFLNGKYPKDYKEMRDFITKDLEKEFKTFDTQKAYRDELAGFFGMDARKYAKILPKALAFKPIDLQAFIYEFLLDDDPVDIRALKNNVEQLKKVELQILKDKEKLGKLDAISMVGEEIESNRNQLIINEIVEGLNYTEQRENYIKQNEDKTRSLDQTLVKYREERVRIDLELESIEAQISNLESLKSNDDLERTINQYRENFNKKQIEYENIKETVVKLNGKLIDEFNLLKEVSNHINVRSFKDFVTYFQKNESNLNVLELESLLVDVANDKDANIQAYNIEKERQESEKQRLSNEIYYIKERINSLKRNVKTYPYAVQLLIKELNERLSDNYNTEIKVYPLAELIEVNDEKWRDALEGQLGNQKFNIIVEPEYFDLALAIYDEIKTEKQIYNVGLVNTSKLSEFHETNPKSLASKVDTSISHARNYVNMLLNNVITVLDAKDLKLHMRSITPSCMTYSNYTARQLNPKTYQIPFIGNSSIETQLAIELDELKALEKKLEQLHGITTNYNTILRLLSNLKSNQIIHQNELKYFDVIKDLRREVIKVEEELLELSKTPSIAKLESQLEVERNRRRQAKLDQERIIGDIRSVRDEIEKVHEALESAKQKLFEYSVKQDDFSKNYPEKISHANTQFYALKQKFKNHATISEELTKEKVSLTNANLRKETELQNQMRMYNREYFFNSEPNFEHLDNYLREANIIRNNNLVKFEHEATELRRNSEIGFKEEFVNKLRSSIDAAKQQIEDLNIALEGKQFGKDSYKLIYKASEDPEYRQYYNMFMDSSSLEDHKLFTEGLSKRNEQLLMELFNKIASSNPEYDKLTFEFLDYRKYMSYDIEVSHSNGTKSLFSKVSKEKSGGETQVPFYIVIAASFQQLLSRNKRINSGCIVLFDEAFNNMDDTRIDAMMKYYSSLSIQLLIAIPPQRVVNIIDYVNTSLVIVKEDDYAIIESFKDSRLVLNK
ncbi:ATP-binding protein [Haploplasma modicum]|uniref:ATP-binding protein n=1 Tax=Haploplasma modicum TaxID=2150 RepID=UPI00047ABA3F|nr:SbcC/MukB-like Walker B domain-containing protein [Haploplasma modicum]